MDGPHHVVRETQPTPWSQDALRLSDGLLERQPMKCSRDEHRVQSPRCDRQRLASSEMCMRAWVGADEHPEHLNVGINSVNYEPSVQQGRGQLARTGPDVDDNRGDTGRQE